MAYTITILLICLYAFGLFFWKKKVAWSFNQINSKRIKTIHYWAFFLTAILTFIYFIFNYCFPGFWIGRILFLFVIITGLIIYPLAENSISNKLETLYFKLFSIFPILFLMVLLVPFLGVILAISAIGTLTNPFEKIYYEDNKIRIQSTFTSPMVVPIINIYSKKSLYEWHLKEFDFRYYEADSVEVKYKNDSTFIYFIEIKEDKSKKIGQTVQFKN